MIIVHVQHFLTEEGKAFFPEWIDHVRNELQNFDGFIELHQAVSLRNSNETHLFLTFESLDSLKIWSTSKCHDLFIEKLAPFMVKKQESTIFKLV